MIEPYVYTRICAVCDTPVEHIPGAAHHTDLMKCATHGNSIHFRVLRTGGIAPPEVEYEITTTE